MSSDRCQLPEGEAAHRRGGTGHARSDPSVGRFEGLAAVSGKWLRDADLRMVPVAAAAWLAAWVGGEPGGLRWLLVGSGIIAVLGGVRRCAVGLAIALVLAGVGGLGALAAYRLASGPVAALAAERAAVSALVVPQTDPDVRDGRGPRGGYATLRATVVELSARGASQRLRQPVLVVLTGTAIEAWQHVHAGSTVRVSAQLDAAEPGGQVAAIVRIRSPPELITGPSAGMRLVERVREGLRSAVAGRSPEQRALVPALVLGDTSAMTPELREDFVATGLSHLTAVSGANLTLLMAFLLTAARWCGVRGWWLRLVGLLGVLAFVVLCRSEPSVVRAAAMGLVALAALGSGARAAGLRNLSAAVVVLLVVDPGLSRSLGFALSVLASAGIVVWARSWSDAIASWAPRWIAEAVAVPLAAQLATQPVVAAIAGQVSLSGLLANALAGPFVGPATVLGFAAAGGSLAAGWLAVIPAFGAAWATQPIVWIAHAGADLPGGSVRWPTSTAALIWLALGCLALAVVLGRLLARRSITLLLALLTVAPLFVVPRQPGWPPPEWLVVGCDVGQGDSLVVRVGPRAALVVDVGPDRRLISRCLAELGIRAIPLLVLSHFHADHVAGLAGLGPRPVGEVWVGALDTPVGEVDRVRRWAAGRSVPITSPGPGTVAVTGDAEISVLGPVPHVSDGDESSVENDESLVLKVTVGGTRLLLTGDVEPAGQQAILRAGVDVSADVLKVPHHGSSRQDEQFFAATGARIAIVSAGADNGYGHPAPRAVQLIAGLGMTLLRTDRQGSVAVSGRDGELSATSQRPG